MTILPKIKYVIFVLCCMLAMVIHVQAAPLMVMEKNKISLDDSVIEGNVAHGVFYVQNKGESELIIKKVAPG